jgi:adenosylcobinamide-GDP ribazoletransferase
MIKELKNLFAFLTILPVGMDIDYLKDSAKYMPIFPLVGAFIGLIAALFSFLLLKILPELIVAMLTLGLILLITGLHHTDGLLDFGDGIMVQGSPEKKIRVMHDQRMGAGGFTMGFITILTTAFCIASLNTDIIIPSLIISEASAKLSMVVGVWLGKPAHEGMTIPFIESMQGKYRGMRLLIALLTTFLVAAYLLGIGGSIMVVSSIMISLVLVRMSNRHFKGITGDVLGAMNEIARMVSLITILAVSPWL